MTSISSYGQGIHNSYPKWFLKKLQYISDDLSHGPEEIFSREETLETINVISGELSTIGLPVFPSLGNHDIIPKNQVIFSLPRTKAPLHNEYAVPSK